MFLSNLLEAYLFGSTIVILLFVILHLKKINSRRNSRNMYRSSRNACNCSDCTRNHNRIRNWKHWLFPFVRHWGFSRSGLLQRSMSPWSSPVCWNSSGSTPKRRSREKMLWRMSFYSIHCFHFRDWSVSWFSLELVMDDIRLFGNYCSLESVGSVGGWY